MDPISVKYITLPNLDKAILISDHVHSKVLLLRAVSGKLSCVAILNEFQGISHYCRHTGLLYFHTNRKLESVNVETLEIQKIGKDVLANWHIWLPYPTHRDLCSKYVPILEASTNLPSDLCRLVTSYLDW